MGRETFLKFVHFLIIALFHFMICHHSSIVQIRAAKMRINNALKTCRFFPDKKNDENSLRKVIKVSYKSGVSSWKLVYNLVGRFRIICVPGGVDH
jgi:hypothetical protein